MIQNNAGEATPTAAASAAELHRVWQATVDWLATHYLQIGIAVAIAAAIVAILLAVRAVGLKICERDTSGTHWSTIISRVIARTRLWFMVPLAAKLVDGYASTPAAVTQTINFLFVIAAALQAAIWARELIIGIVEHRAGGTEVDGTLGSAMGIIRLLVSVAVFAIAMVLILDNLGVNVTGLVAGLGIGGIAIGLAAQGIFSDLFAALSILFDKPFRRGDGIKWDTTSGSVEAIGLKTTRVRSATGEEVVISNANLLNKEVHNFTRLSYRRMIHKFGVTYQTPPEVLERIPGIVEGIVKGQKKCSFLRCGMIGLGASSLDYEVQFDVHSLDYEVVFATNHRTLIEIIAAFAREKIEFAYPTQTTFTAAPDGTLVMPYAEPEGERG